MRPGRAAAAVVTAAGLTQIGPAATWIGSLRLAALPGLAGLGRRDHLALTFDDGPARTSTPLFLAELERQGWRATFFVVGTGALRDPALVRDISAAGHEVGVHGMQHRYLLTRDPLSVALDIRRARDLVGDLTGVTPLWYRPPYGVLTGPAWAAARAMGLRTVLWSAWGRDWLPSAQPQTVVHALWRGVMRGGTALLHDADTYARPGAWRPALGALPLLAEELRMRHITAGPLGEHGLYQPRGAASQ
jgi:peptidoglycan/xylan/chitin deacetylase (PgdA/CDA1 family)